MRADGDPDVEWSLRCSEAMSLASSPMSPIIPRLQGLFHEKNGRHRHGSPAMTQLGSVALSSSMHGVVIFVPPT